MNPFSAGQWRARLLWLLIVLAIIGLDQGTKSLVRANIPDYRHIPIIDNFFLLTHIENPGAAFGIFSDIPDGWREAFLSSLGFVALTLVIIYSLRLKPGEWFSQVALHMIFAGAIGNLLDRLIFGTVTDFLLFRFGGWSFPAFNIADSAIVIGVSLLVLDIFLPEKKEEKADPAAKAMEAAASMDLFGPTMPTEAEVEGMGESIDISEHTRKDEED